MLRSQFSHLVSSPASLKAQIRMSSRSIRQYRSRSTAASPKHEYSNTTIYHPEAVTRASFNNSASTSPSFVWPPRNNVHETWYHLRNNDIPEGWSNDWRTWRLTPLFGPSHRPSELELEITVVHELPRPIRPIMYSKSSSFCFVFQAGSYGSGEIYHWDDDEGTLHRIISEPHWTIEESVQKFGNRKLPLDGSSSELISPTATGQGLFNKMRRAQHQRDAEIREQKIMREQSTFMPFKLINTFDELLEIQKGLHAHGQMAGFNTHDDL